MTLQAQQFRPRWLDRFEDIGYLAQVGVAEQ